MPRKKKEKEFKYGFGLDESRKNLCIWNEKSPDEGIIISEILEMNTTVFKFKIITDKEKGGSKTLYLKPKNFSLRMCNNVVSTFLEKRKRTATNIKDILSKTLDSLTEEEEFGSDSESSDGIDIESDNDSISSEEKLEEPVTPLESKKRKRSSSLTVGEPRKKKTKVSINYEEELDDFDAIITSSGGVRKEKLKSNPDSRKPKKAVINIFESDDEDEEDVEEKKKDKGGNETKPSVKKISRKLKNRKSSDIADILTNKCIGNLIIKVKNLTAPTEDEVSSTSNIRSLQSNHVNLMKNSLKDTGSSTLRFKQAAQVHLVCENPQINFIAKVNKIIKSGTVDQCSFEINKLIENKKNKIKAYTIGGNHTRQAVMELIDEGCDGFDENLSLTCSCYVNLTDIESIKIGKTDNDITATFNPVSLLEKVTLVRNIVTTTKELTDDHINLVIDILKTGPSNLTLNSARPLIIACKVPDEFWPKISKLIDEGKLNTGHLKALTWKSLTYFKTDLHNLFDDYLKATSKFKSKYNSRLEIIKAKLYATISAFKLYKSEEHASNLEKDKFFKKFINQEIKPINDIVLTYKNQLCGKNLTLAKKKQFDTALFKKDCESIFHFFDYGTVDNEPASESIQKCNNASIQSLHKYFEVDCLENFKTIADSDRRYDVSAIVIDPPYGIFSDTDWDKLWDPNSYLKLFSSCKNKFSGATLIIFLADFMMFEMLSALQGASYKYTFYHWYIPNKKIVGTTIQYTCNFIIVAHQDGVKLDKKEDGLETKNVFGTLIVCNSTEQFMYKGKVANNSEKPLRLLRGLLYNFCPPKTTVIDICCGSGTTAIAAFTLGLDSISVDNNSTQLAASQERMIHFEDSFSEHPQEIFKIQLKVPQKNKPKPKSPSKKNTDLKFVNVFPNSVASTEERIIAIEDYENESGVVVSTRDSESISHLSTTPIGSSDSEYVDEHPTTSGKTISMPTTEESLESDGEEEEIVNVLPNTTDSSRSKTSSKRKTRSTPKQKTVRNNNSGIVRRGIFKPPTVTSSVTNVPKKSLRNLPTRKSRKDPGQVPPIPNFTSLPNSNIRESPVETETVEAQGKVQLSSGNTSTESPQKNILAEILDNDMSLSE